MQAVFDLPKKMRAALEGDMLDTAVSFYAEAQPLLAKYGNRGAFRQIAAESQQVAKEMAQVRAGCDAIGQALRALHNPKT